MLASDDPWFVANWLAASFMVQWLSTTSVRGRGLEAVSSLIAGIVGRGPEMANVLRVVDGGECSLRGQWSGYLLALLVELVDQVAARASAMAETHGSRRIIGRSTNNCRLHTPVRSLAKEVQSADLVSGQRFNAAWCCAAHCVAA